jgi:hypothetical protein
VVHILGLGLFGLGLLKLDRLELGPLEFGLGRSAAEVGRWPRL